MSEQKSKKSLNQNLQLLWGNNFCVGNPCSLCRTHFLFKKKTNFVFVFVLAGLRHRARQLNLDSEDETDIISTTSYEERIHVRIFRTISRSLVAIYTSILYYIALSTSTIKDTFSRYFLRRTSYSSKVSSNDRAFWIPWSPDKKYTSAAYFSGEH